jgi:hypothetical protein
MIALAANDGAFDESVLSSNLVMTPNKKSAARAEMTKGARLSTQTYARATRQILKAAVSSRRVAIVLFSRLDCRDQRAASTTSVCIQLSTRWVWKQQSMGMATSTTGTDHYTATIYTMSRSYRLCWRRRHQRPPAVQGVVPPLPRAKGNIAWGGEGGWLQRVGTETLLGFRFPVKGRAGRVARWLRGAVGGWEALHPAARNGKRGNYLFG